MDVLSQEYLATKYANNSANEAVRNARKDPDRDYSDYDITLMWQDLFNAYFNEYEQYAGEPEVLMEEPF